MRYGKHLPEADRFLAAYRSLASPPPLALASVNLTARKPEKTTATGNAYLRKTIARHRPAPALAVAFAGRLDYRRYSWRDRQIIRFIMLLTGGPTDPDTSDRIHVVAGGRRIRRPHRRAGAAHLIVAYAAWAASCQGENMRTNTDNMIIGMASTIPAANKPSRPKMGG